MSTIRTDYNLIYEIFAGTKKTFTLIVEDPGTGNVLDLSDTSIYNTATVKIVKPDGTLIATITAVYSNRVAGEIDFTVDETVSTNKNAGNWLGDMELVNTNSETVNQQLFNFNIRESY